MSEVLGVARPWLLGLLLLVPVWDLWRERQRRRRAVAFAPLQHRAGRPGRALLDRLAHGCEGLVLGVVILALAAPYGESRLDLMEDEGVDVMLVLDVSLSMLAEDLPPNRLAALQQLSRDFIARAGGNRIGIVIFAGDAYVQTPLTTDHRSLRELLDGVTVYTINQSKSGGTAIGDALLVAGERLVAGRVEGRDQSLIIITDGESNLGVEPELAARWVAEQGIRLYAIGVGAEEAVEVFFEGERVGGEDAPYLAALDDSRLLSFTDAAGGRYWRATDVGTLTEIFDQLSRLESAPLEVRTVAVRRSWADLLSLAVLVLFVGYLALDGWILRRPLR